MSPSSKNVANAVGGKTARACDSCITKRARWYCAADDAFLCQACDSSVHSANPLARRHERLRLKTATLDPLNTTCAPTWHHGFTKKARTPRNGGKSNHRNNHSSSSTRRNNNNQQPFHLVPEEGEGEGSDEVNSHEENEEQLLYRVPVFDPFVAELCSPADNNNKKDSQESKGSFACPLHGFLPSEAELAEFAADVESLLGRGMENECVGMEHLGLIDNNKDEESWDCSAGSGNNDVDNKVVKVEMEHEQEHMDATCSGCKLEEGDNQMMMMEIGRETAFQLSFDYDESHETEEIDKEKVKEKEDDDEDAINKKRKILLQLDYEGVINAWGGNHKSPWTTGHKPNLDLHDCWPHTMATGGTELHHGYGELMIGLGCNPSSVILGDGGREARVSRYREKRRTRLFSKKIRYEVRKLNAEKRPRMKGRFVKRASFAAPPATFPLIA